MIRRLGAALLVVVCVTSVAAQIRKPKVPPGRDPGGLAVALFTSGIDYTRREVAERLARDGEGDLIGWDMVDDDNRPYAPAPDAPTGAAPNDAVAGLPLLLSSSCAVRLVPIRVDPARPVSLARALSFAARTPARIVVVAMNSDQKEQWEPFRQAAMQFPQLLIVAPSGGAASASKPVISYPAGLDLPNLAIVGEVGDAGSDIEIVRSEGAGTAAPATKAASLIAALLEGLAQCAAARSEGGAVVAPASSKLSRLIEVYRDAVPGAQAAGQKDARTCTLRSARL